MPDPAPTQLPLAERLMNSARDFVQGDPTLAALQTLRQDEDGPITPDSDQNKGPRLILVGADVGRVKPYAPIRSFHLEFRIRGNAKVQAGKADAFKALCYALENLLDSSNLTTSLTSAKWQVNVMLATRQPGCIRHAQGNIRQESYMLEVKAVGAEHCVTQ